VGIDSPLYERFAQQLMFGLAWLQAETLGTEVVPVVVRNRAQRDHTADELDELVACWGTLGVRVAPENEIDVAPLLDPRARRVRVAAPRASAGAAASKAFRVMAILFADVEDYSQIPERHLPSFIEHFVGGVANRLCVHPYRAENVRRVGDGLLMAFATVRDAALCALDLTEWLVAQAQPGADGETFWSRIGLPREIRARFALHAGPVFECIDPLTRAATFEGAHINYAARIEPVTPGNQVYASEAFAALAVSWPEACEEFVCEYVGQTSLAKQLGEYPLYHIRRRA
jgi:class 3 adenylate cyclase